MGSKYVDTAAIIQVIGNIYNHPSLFDFTDKYFFSEDDFPNEFHRIAFGSIYKLYELGAKQINLDNIHDYLASRPQYEAVFNQNRGYEWIKEIAEKAISSSFDYYYGRMKKMTLLREFDNHGINVRYLYDPDNILDTKKRQKQEELLDTMSLEELAQKVINQVDEIRSKYVDNNTDESVNAGEGIFELIQDLKRHPEVGVPLYGPLINTVTRGARLKKFYLRSAATGTGKSRSLIADACYIACDKIYDENFGWINNGQKEPVLYITTEQDLGEVQTMMLAFLSNVNEEHILNGKYTGDEEERVLEAARILQDSPLYVDEMPDFSLQDVENRIKKAVRDFDIRYVVYDYIHTSMKILEEITKRSGGVKLREDNILFMMAIRLKDLCNQLEIFLLSATQLNADYQTSATPDQNLLRGAKSIGDKIDVGMILLNVRQEDLVALEPVLCSGCFDTPTLKISIYKNRRGRWKGVYLWCKADLGTCRIQPMFCTGYDYELKEIENLKIVVDEPSAF